jgi:hypothetical protein
METQGIDEERNVSGTPALRAASKLPRTLRTWAATLLLAVLPLAWAATPASARWHSNPDDVETGEGGTVGSGGPPPWSFPHDGFNWRAPNRYSKWDDAWRQQGWLRDWPVETYDPNYVNPTSWNLTMQGCQTSGDYHYDNYPDDEDAAPPTHSYQWKWNGHTIAFGTNCYVDLNFPTQGTYYVELTVKKPDGSTQTFTKPVRVKDHLIVVLGDSSASGEGAPDTRLYPYSPEGARAEWVDNRCHRSANAGGAQAARRIENSDPYSSVTFLSFACSGATLITEIYNGSTLDPYEDEHDHEYRGVGITDEYAGIEPLNISGGDDPDFSQKLPSQVDQLWRALSSNGVKTTREIDSLIVAGGINDARFADLAAICLLYDGCPLELVGETPGTQRTLDAQFRFDVARVAPGYDALAQELAYTRTVGGSVEAIKIKKKLALTYPPFFHDEDGDQCLAVLWDAIPLWVRALVPLTITMGWDAAEIAWANAEWAPLLNSQVSLGATRNGFEVVDTIPERFFFHGMCAAENWINTATQSGAIQGDDTGNAGALASVFSKGTAHPNTTGYAAYADEIIEHLTHLVGGSQPPVAVPDKFNSGSGLPTWHNVLANDTDPDGDTLTARVVSKPKHGTFELLPDGLVTYKPSASYIGDDSFTYEVTDGLFSRFTHVSITVEKPFKIVTEINLDSEDEVGGLIGLSGIEGPYEVVLDKLPRPNRGYVTMIPGVDGFLFHAADLRRRMSVRLRYTVYSLAPITSPSYGQSVRGIVKVRMLRDR